MCLVVRNVPSEVWGNSYDDERLLSVNDWYHRTARELSENYLEKGVWPEADSSLINGRGKFNCSLIDPDQICNPAVQGPAIIKVKQGKRYRFRILNSSATNAYNITIDAHKMAVIETDGVDTQKSPKFDTLFIIPGQRYSVIVVMDQPVGEYWIRIKSNPSGTDAEAILIVEPTPEGLVSLSQPNFEPTEPVEGASQGRSHHHDVPWQDIITSGGIKIPSTDELQRFFPEKLVHLDLQKQSQRDGAYARLIKRTPLPTSIPVDPTTAIVFDENQAPPIKSPPDGGSAPKNVDRTIKFEVTDCPTPEQKARMCMNGNSYAPRNITSMPILHAVIKGHSIAANQIPVVTPNYLDVVRIVINNHHPWHPWHLHGHTVWVLGAGEEGAGVYNATRDEPNLNFNGVRRDTFFTNGNSWSVVAYLTDNPGVWFFHCHISWHLEAGLGATFIESGSIARRIYHVPPFESKKTCAKVGVRI